MNSRKETIDHSSAPLAADHSSAPLAATSGGGGSETDCAQVLERVYQFIDHELDTASGDTIRQHLAACEPCLDTVDMEQAVKALVSRTCGGDTAPEHLKHKVLSGLAEARRQAEYR